MTAAEWITAVAAFLTAIAVIAQVFILRRQTNIIDRQREISERQEERMTPDLGYFIEEAKVFYETDKPTQLFLHITGVIINKSLATNSTMRMQIRFSNIPSILSVEQLFTQVISTGGTIRFTNKLFTLSTNSFFNVQEKTFEELKNATERLELEITDIYEKPYAYTVPEGMVVFDGNGNLKRYYETRLS